MQNNPKVISLPFIHHGRVLENKHHPHLLLGYFSEVLQVHHKLVEKEGEDYGYAKFTDTIDTLIVGRRTYDYVLNEIGSSHYDNGQRDVYVITRTEKPQVGRTHFYTGDLSDLVNRLKSEKGKNIYCDGGAEVINELLKHDLVDEFIISVIPVLLGNGTRLFKGGRPEQLLEFITAKTFETGLTQLHYKRKK